MTTALWTAITLGAIALVIHACVLLRRKGNG
jgi:hypothetical protein